MFIPEVATLPMASKPAMVDTAKGTSVDSENGEIVSPPPPILSTQKLPLQMLGDLVRPSDKTSSGL